MEARRHAAASPSAPFKSCASRARTPGAARHRRAHSAAQAELVEKINGGGL